MPIHKDEVGLSSAELSALDNFDRILSGWLKEDAKSRRPLKYPIYGPDSLTRLAGYHFYDKLKRALLSRFKRAGWKVKESKDMLEFS